MSSASSAKILHFYNRADYNTIEKCTLQFSGITTGTTSSSTGNAYVWFSTATTSLSGTSSYNGIENTINGCLMRTTNSNSPGPTYAIGLALAVALDDRLYTELLLLLLLHFLYKW